MLEFFFDLRFCLSGSPVYWFPSWDPFLLLLAQFSVWIAFALVFRYIGISLCVYNITRIFPNFKSQCFIIKYTCFCAEYRFHFIPIDFSLPFVIE